MIPPTILCSHRNIFTEPLPSNDRRDTFYLAFAYNDRRDTHMDPDLLEGFMKYAVEIGSVQ
jgi:hypothetical protein